MSEIKNKKAFEVELDGAKTLKLEVRRPDPRQQQQANLVYARTFRQMVKPEDGKAGAIVRAALDNVMREQKLWDDVKQEKYEGLVKNLLSGERRLVSGGFKLKEARGLAIDMRRWRAEMSGLTAERNALDLNTAEAQAEQAKFNYMVSACTVYAESGKPFFKNEDDYASRPGDDAAAGKAAEQFGQLYYGLDEDYRKKLPENAFLLKYGFAREKDLFLVNEKGHPVNEKGDLVDDKGRLVNEKGELVDAEGNLLTEAGDYKVEFKPFLDDAGAEVKVVAGPEAAAKPEAAAAPEVAPAA